jgi:N-methylhydantoinase A
LGTKPAVTDAHVVLGRIAANQLAGGSLPVDVDRARTAIAPIAERLSIPLEHAAGMILEAVNANMQRAIRHVSVERGHDPRRFALVAFGGSGGLHACELAESLEIPVVLVPAHAGVLSALGMLMATHVRDYAASVLGKEVIEDAFEELERTARADLPDATLERSYDVRYLGQSYELQVHGLAEFHDKHAKEYGYSHPGHPVEVVTVRVRASRTVNAPALHTQAPEPSVDEERQIWHRGEWLTVSAIGRFQTQKTPAAGPALVLDYGSTTFVPPGWSYCCDDYANLVLTRTLLTEPS